MGATMSEAEHLADWLDQAATAADLGRPEVKTDNRRLAAKALRKQQAEIDALRAKLAALEGAYIPTYLERLAASPATLEAEFTALRSEALDLRAALAERDARLAALEKQEPVDWIKLNKEADVIVRSKPTWKRFIDGTPLSNDISVWMADFAEIYAAVPKEQLK